MQPSALLEFLRRHRLAVEASVTGGGSPQAAVIGVAVSDSFEIVFDTLTTSRKCRNLRDDPRIALVVGWDLDDACTAQIEGVADEPQGEELERSKRLYFSIFPDGVERQAWPDITYVRVRPSWIRFSDFRGSEPRLVEFGPKELR